MSNFSNPRADDTEAGPVPTPAETGGSLFRGGIPEGAGDSLARLAALVQLGGVLLGAAALLAAPAVGPRGTWASIVVWTIAMLVAVVCGLAGWVAGRLLRNVARSLASYEARADQAEDTGRLVAAALGRIAEALERAGNGPVVDAVASLRPPDAIRRAIEQGHWEQADALLRDFVQSHPEDPEGPRLTAGLDEARTEAAGRMRAQIEAAREVGDTDRVFELRDAVIPLLEPEAGRALEQELARWFMALIHKRLRTGTMLTDVAVLAARVADRMDATPEGASLRAALPTLRRSGGLCARCGQPYGGVADACPSCSAASSTVPVPHPEGSNSEPDPADDEFLTWSPTPDDPV